MPVILNHFESLRSNYSTWSELKEHLTSKAGGSIRVVGQDTEQNVVLRYVKGESSFRTPGVGMFRSVVWDTVANLPVCVAPVKSEDGAPPLNKTFTSIQDFLDGVLMQVYVTAAEPTVQTHCRTSKTCWAPISMTTSPATQGPMSCEAVWEATSFPAPAAPTRCLGTREMIC